MTSTTTTCAVRVLAVRPTGSGSAATRSVIATTILALLRAVSGAELECRVSAEASDFATLGWELAVSAGGDEIGPLTEELVALLEAHFVVRADHVSPSSVRIPTSQHRGSPTTYVARPSTGSLGFVVSRRGEWEPSTDASSGAFRNLFAAMIRRPGAGLVTRLRTAGDRGVEVSVSAVDLSLGMKAAGADVFDGLEWCPDGEVDGHQYDSRNGSWLQAGKEIVDRILLLPLSDGEIPPGFLAGPPPVVPILRRWSSRQQAGCGVRLGHAADQAGVRTPVVCSDAELVRHVHVVGATGTGKSTLLAQVVRHAAESGHGALVLDPHGTLVDRIAAELPESALDRVMVVRAADLANPVPLSPLAGDDEVAIETSIASMGEMFYELFDPGRTGIVGPRFVDRVSHALRGLVCLRGDRASLLDVPMMLGNKRMRAELMKRLTDESERMWWENDVLTQKSSEHGELVAWVNSKFESFSASPALRAILGTGCDGYDAARAYDDGRIVLVDLAKGQLGDAPSRLLGYLLLNRFWTAAMQRNNDRRFHVIVDEAHSMMAGALVSMLSEGRKFGLSVMVAHQFLGQLDPAMERALAGNVGTSVIFRTSGEDLVKQVRQSGGMLDAAALSRLPNLTAMSTRSAADDVIPEPFTLEVAPPDPTVSLSRERIDRLAAVRDRMVGDDVLAATPLDVEEYSVAVPDRRISERARFLDEWIENRHAAGRDSSTDDSSRIPGADRTGDPDDLVELEGA